MAWKSAGTDAIMRGTSGRGYWIAQGLAPQEDMRAPRGLRDEPTVGVWLDRASESLARNDFVLVDAQASAALRLDPTNEQAAEALRMRAVALWFTKCHAGAIEDAEKALELDPDAATGPVTAADIASKLVAWRWIQALGRDRP